MNIPVTASALLHCCLMWHNPEHWPQSEHSRDEGHWQWSQTDAKRRPRVL